MRTYSKTHPWLTFGFPSEKIDARLWIALGEVQSKCEHIAGVPLKPATADYLHRLYLAKGALATTAIEGNTLSEEQARKVLAGGLDLPPSKQYLAREIENIAKACDEIYRRLSEDESPTLTVSLIKEFNRAILSGLTLEEGVVPGEIRVYSAGVPGYRGAPPEDCEYLLDRLCDWLNGEAFQPTGVPEIAAAALKATVAHLYLAWIHPFGDGNGRTARLVEVQILMAAGVPTVAAHLLSNHYNKTRQEYYRQLSRASASGGNILPFADYAINGLVEELKAHLEDIRFHQWDVAWENYVYERFRETADREPDKRRRQLLLDLSNNPKPCPILKIPDLSPEIARMYAKKTRKTISRDVNALEAMGLIERTERGVIAKREIILAFLPR